jgi:death-on-curing protein
VILYLSVDQVLDLHRDLVSAFGGTLAVREKGLLESAVARPTMTFDGEDLYPDLAAKAAALMHSLVMNHPFVDGNKRIGAASAELFVECNGSVILASDEEFETLTLALARGAVAVEALTIWFRQRLRMVDIA